jgi:very-short-patch-repair endonuclease
MSRRKHEDKSYLFAHAWQMLAPDMPTPTAEYNFDHYVGRRHRFDWAFIDLRIGVEVDGGQFAKFGGRHAGDGDREKLNIAAELGWLVFRFSTQMLENDPLGCVEQVKRAINNQT